MNKNQKTLYKALETISCAVLALEDAQNIVDKMKKEEVIEVVNKFSDKITEFDKESLYQDSYNFEGYANSIIDDVSTKISDD